MNTNMTGLKNFEKFSFLCLSIKRANKWIYDIFIVKTGFVTFTGGSDIQKDEIFVFCIFNDKHSMNNMKYIQNE